jgi:predicted DNA-binding protein
MFFRRRKRQADSDANPDAGQDTLPRSSLAPYKGDLAVFRSDEWEPMKVWLPEQVDEIIAQLSDHWSASRSAIIRDTLFVYVYGQYTFTQMQADRDGFFYDSGTRFFSRSPNRMQSLGKNTKNYKVFLPERLRDDLKTLANQSGLTLSHFTREVLISSFMGHQSLSERQTLLEEAKRQPQDWPPEQDEALPRPEE